MKDAFYLEQNRKNLNKVFLSLQEAMKGVLQCKGDNNYRLKHMKNDKLLKDNMLPVALHCDQELINIANDILDSPEEHFPNMYKKQKTSVPEAIPVQNKDDMMVIADL